MKIPASIYAPVQTLVKKFYVPYGSKLYWITSFGPPAFLHYYFMITGNGLHSPMQNRLTACGFFVELHSENYRGGRFPVAEARLRSGEGEDSEDQPRHRGRARVDCSRHDRRGVGR